MSNKTITTIAGILALAFVLTIAGPVQVFAVPPSLTADNQAVTTDENTEVAITLTGDGPSGFIFVVDSQPANGVLTGTAPDLTYTPNTDYTGADSFTFHTNKGGNDSAIATVSITVEEVIVTPPVVCDEGFHLEGEVCVADEETEEPPVLTCDEGFHVEGEECVADEETEEEPPVLTCDEGFHVEDEACVADEEVPPTTPPVQKGSSHFSLARVAAQGLSGLTEIPQSTTGATLYEVTIGPQGGNLMSAMRTTTLAGLDWNSLTEGQQVWLVENFNSLLG